ncbi:hypothetical protein F4809DRAFT_598139 [Biscogniauxia mediterranea]|nr:hypothetical protein F4809DRAFT_598139 [Biscogniauxia mediterranea]
MTSRALRGGAHACRSCPSLRLRLRLRLRLSLNSPDAGQLCSSPGQQASSMWRSLHTAGTATTASQTHVSPATKPSRDSLAVYGSSWPVSNSGAGSTRFRGVSMKAGYAIRNFSITAVCCQGQKGEENQSPPSTGLPSQPEKKQKPPPPKVGEAIRKAIPKVLPSLTTVAHENIYTVPNLLTFSRLAVAPFIGYAILHDAHTWALGLFAYAGVSDLLDGWIARRWKLQTVVGSVVDPMADKTLMTVLTVCLATQGALPVWLAAIILGRDVGLGIAAIYYRWISLPPPKTFTRYWDFSLPSAEVRPTTISKYNTFLQLGLMGATMVTPFVSADLGVAMTAFQYLVATTTVWSGLSYVFSKDAVKILSESKGKSKKK